jgi:hypothetical protein
MYHTSHKSKKVDAYFNNHKVALLYIFTESPEFMILEEILNMTKPYLHILKYYSSFVDFKYRKSRYLLTNRLNFTLRHYLLRCV